MAAASRVVGTTFNAVNVNVYDDDDSALARHRYMLIDRYLACGGVDNCLTQGKTIISVI